MAKNAHVKYPEMQRNHCSKLHQVHATEDGNPSLNETLNRGLFRPEIHSDSTRAKTAVKSIEALIQKLGWGKVSCWIPEKPIASGIKNTEMKWNEMERLSDM